jgi:Xaa-Pro aminopeptidase
VTSAPSEFYVARWERLRADLARRRLDALLVTSAANVAYLTGFFGTAGAVVVTASSVWLLSDGRYAEAVALRREGVAGLRTEVVPAGGGSLEEAIASRLGALAPQSLGIEGHHLTLRQYRDLERRLGRLGLSVELNDAESPVEQLRLVKDAWEIQTFREAGQRLSDVAKYIVPKALAGVRERDLAAQVEAELRRVGFDRPAFDTIVASGPNSAMPHYRAGDRVLETGDLVVLDFGGVLRGYCVDMTRTLSVGRDADGWSRSLLEGVVAAQQAAFDAIREGIAADEVDAAARVVLGDRGLGEAFTHGLGHGLGLEIHERPRLVRRREGVALDTLQSGMVFTLEPGVYFPGRGGVRVEDDVLVAERGAEWLTVAAV